MNKYLLLILSVFFSQTVWAQDSIQTGMTANQVTNIKGSPYYQTEHYSNKKGEEIWLYTKKKESKTVDEKKIIDTQTNWPTLYRKTVTRTCDVGDIFVEMSQNKVKSVLPAKSTVSYGPCVITTLEEYLPIVDGKPTNKPAKQTTNTILAQ